MRGSALKKATILRASSKVSLSFLSRSQLLSTLQLRCLTGCGTSDSSTRPCSSRTGKSVFQMSLTALMKSAFELGVVWTLCPAATITSTSALLQLSRTRSVWLVMKRRNLRMRRRRT